MNLELSLGYEFKDRELFQMALTHKSFYHENHSFSGKTAGDSRGLKGHNEKLEFLGDAVVDLSMTELLMQMFPHDSEGQLSKKRASLVNESVLAEVADSIGIAQNLRLGKGEQLSGGEKKPRLLASALEALVGAVFTETGFEEAHKSVKKLFQQKLEQLSTEVDFGLDYKTRLQEIVQSESKPVPSYRLVSETGPSHDRVFEVEVNIKEYPPMLGTGRSKKSAEQEAARVALQLWQVKEVK